MSRQTWMAGITAVGFLLACAGAEIPSTSAPSAPASAPAPVAAGGVDADDGSADAGDEGDDAEEGAEGEAADDPEAEGEGDTPAEAGAADASDASCCVYDGPLGETHALVDDEAACTSDYADKNPRMVAGSECVPVCCRYDGADAEPGEGSDHAVLATGDCTLRKGAVVAFGADTCRDPDAPVPKPRPKPKAAPVVIPPLTRPGTDGGRGGRRGGTRPTPNPRPRGGGGLTRPGG